MGKKKDIKKKIPEIKKTINAFLVGEEGKISKQSILKVGVILSVVSLGGVKDVSAHVNHTNNLDFDYDGTGTLSTVHNHHVSHDSGWADNHNAHASHASGTATATATATGTGTWY